MRPLFMRLKQLAIYNFQILNVIILLELKKNKHFMH